MWHPGLVAALVGGGLALVVMTAWLTPKVGPTIVGANTLAAVAAIVAVLVWGVGANLGWWKGLAGLWKWATDASHKTAATSGVVALLMFLGGWVGFGLVYSGHGAAGACAVSAGLWGWFERVWFVWAGCFAVSAAADARSDAGLSGWDQSAGAGPKQLDLDL
ncbi:hypothetical protein I540_6051 [Mycobacteroides abscessus subsp. bolletii 1513]|uniref:Transmembrane protein n=1 Tax=Mycobacteroides abscessus subsp. bolletii 1513 TaxID=1299321 RepID=X8DDY3_9MYCO|nr:hypothetical protein I540_6051 [Mycobacteroides abscessus subsp. bolletii 1513]